MRLIQLDTIDTANGNAEAQIVVNPGAIVSVIPKTVGGTAIAAEITLSDGTQYDIEQSPQDVRSLSAESSPGYSLPTTPAKITIQVGGNEGSGGSSRDLGGGGTVVQ